MIQTIHRLQSSGFAAKLAVAIVLAPAVCLGAPISWSGEIKGLGHKTAGNFEVDVVNGIAYHEGQDADPVRHKLDLYLPKDQKKYPVLIFVHGGTWKSGSKELYAPLGKLFAKNGIGTVIINYRLSPKVKHPEHIKDVAKAFAWTKNKIAQHGGDPTNIFVCGHSAGGHLVSLLSANETYLRAENLAIKDIKGTIPISGVFVLAPLGPLKDVFTDDKDIVKSASPIEHVAAGRHPPCMLIYAEKELATLDIQAEQMCKKLTECQCDARTLRIADRTHLTIIINAARESDPVTQAIFEFLAKHGGLKLKVASKL